MSKKQAFNPYLPSWEYIPDGEPYVFGDRVYVYGSHDFFDGYVFCMGDYVCWSAPVNDLSDWRYEGVIYPRNEDPRNKDGKMCLYAPDVTVGPDGRYYLYYVLDKINIMSVAVCDTSFTAMYTIPTELFSVKKRAMSPSSTLACLPRETGPICTAASADTGTRAGQVQRSPFSARIC